MERKRWYFFKLKAIPLSPSNFHLFSVLCTRVVGARLWSRATKHLAAFRTRQEGWPGAYGWIVPMPWSVWFPAFCCEVIWKCRVVHFEKPVCGHFCLGTAGLLFFPNAASPQAEQAPFPQPLLTWPELALLPVLHWIHSSLSKYSLYLAAQSRHSVLDVL